MNCVNEAYLNRIATAVPDHDVHSAFVNFADHLMAAVACFEGNRANSTVDSWRRAAAH